MSEGAIALRARAQLPATWDALGRSSQYGPAFLDAAVEFVKFQVNGTILDQSQELSSYNPMLQTYMGKLVALQVIPAGIDYWADQPITENLTGTNESVTWVDRRDGLYRLYTTLSNEVQELASQVEVELGRKIMRRAATPTVTRPGGYVTPDPALFQQQRGVASAGGGAGG